MGITAAELPTGPIRPPISAIKRHQPEDRLLLSFDTTGSKIDLSATSVGKWGYLEPSCGVYPPKRSVAPTAFGGALPERRPPAPTLAVGFTGKPFFGRGPVGKAYGGRLSADLAYLLGKRFIVEAELFGLEEGYSAKPDIETNVATLRGVNRWMVRLDATFQLRAALRVSVHLPQRGHCFGDFVGVNDVDAEFF